MSLLIRDCSWIVTQNASRNVLKNSSVYVEDGRIAEIGKQTARDADRVLNGEGMILLPGLINTHTHAPMVVFRGYADDMPLQEWLSEKIWKLEPNMTSETCYWGTMLSCLEMIASGTTTFNDMYFFVKDVARAVADAGLRAVLSSVIIDVSPDSKLHRDNAGKVLDFLKGLKTPLVTPAIAPHAVYSCSEETLLWAKDRADKEQISVHTHIAETKTEQAEMENRRKQKVVEYLDKIGFLGSNVVGAHCVWLSSNEIKLLAQSGTKVAHCPVSNMKLAVGAPAPISEMLQSGVCVGLGTDGAASNNTLNMFETMKFCALLEKHSRWDPTALPAQRTLDLATIEAAKVLGMEKNLGSIEAGKLADLILVDTRSPNLTPIHGRDTVISDLVYSASGANVDTTIVNGRILMERQQFATLHPSVILENVSKVTEDLIARSTRSS
jgi:5-methylthioadenosine/S-adenosylhomocysteine deaminase